MQDSQIGSALTDLEGAKSLAKKIFQIYDKDASGEIETYEIGIFQNPKNFQGV